MPRTTESRASNTGLPGLGGDKNSSEVVKHERAVLFTDIRTYVDIYNLSNHLRETAAKKRISQMAEEQQTKEAVKSNPLFASGLARMGEIYTALAELRRKPIRLHPDDLEEIVATISLSPKKNKKTKLTERLDQVKSNHTELVNNGTVDLLILPNRITHLLPIFRQGESANPQYQQAGTELATITTDYFNRSITLRRLAAGPEDMQRYMADQFKQNFQRLLREGVKSLRNFGLTKSLYPHRIHELSGYFLQQAEIDALKFRTLLAYLYTFANKSEPILQAYGVYNVHMDIFADHRISSMTPADARLMK
jgi:hypothetical protein